PARAAPHPHYLSHLAGTVRLGPVPAALAPRSLTLARGGRPERLGRHGRDDHAFAQRRARSGDRPLLAEVRLFAVLAQVEPAQLGAHVGLDAHRGLHDRQDHRGAEGGERDRRQHPHVTSAMAAAVFVFVNASAARPLAARAEPALNPNQPNHSNPAPSSTSGTLCGTMAARLKSLRGPSIRAATSADTPELMWTTV